MPAFSRSNCGNWDVVNAFVSRFNNLLYVYGAARFCFSTPANPDKLMTVYWADVGRIFVDYDGSEPGLYQFFCRTIPLFPTATPNEVVAVPLDKWRHVRECLTETLYSPESILVSVDFPTVTSL